MTTKEFIRSSYYFESLEKACSFFIDIDCLDFIFKFEVIFDDSRSIIFNTIPCISFDNSSSVVFYSCERFTRIQFISQFRYFLSFLSRLSEYQYSSLVSSGCFTCLLKFKDEMSK